MLTQNHCTQFHSIQYPIQSAFSSSLSSVLCKNVCSRTRVCTFRNPYAGPSNIPLSVYSNSIFSSVHSFTHKFFFSSAKHKHIYALNAFNKSVSIWNTPDLVLFSQHHNTQFDPQLLLAIRGQSD